MLKATNADITNEKLYLHLFTIKERNKSALTYLWLIGLEEEMYASVSHHRINKEIIS